MRLYQTFLFTLALFAYPLVLAACDSPADAVRKIRYYRDARTGICYASGYFQYTDGGLVFTYVPCEKIPPQMLLEVRP